MRLTDEFRPYQIALPAPLPIAAGVLEPFTPMPPTRVVWARQFQMYYVAALEQFGPTVTLDPSLVREAARDKDIGSEWAALYYLTWLKLRKVGHPTQQPSAAA